MSVYVVVHNDEEQYSLWPAGRDLPTGWYSTAFSGVEDDCLRHIEQTWIDMRPRSLRDAMKGSE